jgi:hypothetical protein
MVLLSSMIITLMPLKFTASANFHLQRPFGFEPARGVSSPASFPPLYINGADRRHFAIALAWRRAKPRE